MALFDKYDIRRKELLKQAQSFKEFEESDSNVHKIVEIARAVLTNPNAMVNVNTLLKNGGYLAGYFGYLLTRGNDAWADWKAAEIAFKEVRDALMLSYKEEKRTVTEAKATAARETGLVEMDVLIKEKRARDYEAVGKWCQSMLTFIQSALRQIENERANTKLAERGTRPVRT